MTIKDLINELQCFDENMEVVIRGCNTSYCDSIGKVTTNGIQSFFGEDRNVCIIRGIRQTGKLNEGRSNIMSKTGQTLEKLPQNIRDHIENLKEHYQHEQLKHDVRIGSGSYTLALYQMGLVTETEKRLLFSYITL